ncbi:MAG TPA: hypothetical protein VGG92_20485 [Caulobacteraceae bacterium]|jgi:hypothetical protein
MGGPHLAQLNPSEALAARYLTELNIGIVVHEPDGNAAPDFSVGRRLAVEVRRLNQNHETGGAYAGLETAKAAILARTRKVLPRFGPAPEGRGWWVSYYYWRPLDWKAFKAHLPKVLAAFKEAPREDGVRIRVTPTFEMEIERRDSVAANYYTLATFVDRDEGGFVVSEIIRNLNLCITEKDGKIAHCRDRYAEWWLLLPNHIGPDVDPASLDILHQHVDLKGFDQVILLHPRDHRRAFTINRRPASIAESASA